MKYLLMAPVWIYRRFISPFKPRTCRFIPTCSQYSMVALQRHGALRGSWLTIRRLSRCHPFCEPGWDPVPERYLPPDSVDEGGTSGSPDTSD